MQAAVVLSETRFFACAQNIDVHVGVRNDKAKDRNDRAQNLNARVEEQDV